MDPNHRSPYLLAYPVVIFSAWVWGLPASIASAAVAGLLIERFMFSTHRVTLAPTASAWLFRESIFLAGSILVGALTRSAARQKERIATAELEQRVRAAEAEAIAATEKARATELALENEARELMALDGANVGFWELNLETNQSKWSNGFYRLHGLVPSSTASYEVWRSCIHPQDVARVEESLKQAFAEHAPFYEQYRLANGIGPSVTWIAFRGAAVQGVDGKPAIMSGYAGEITRRKLADLALIQSEKLAVAGRMSAGLR